MDEYEMKLVIDELLKLVARLKMENTSREYENACLKEDVESLRREVARLEAKATESVEAKAD